MIIATPPEHGRIADAAGYDRRMGRMVFRRGPGRIGCLLVGPAAIVLGLAACAAGSWVAGWLLARPMSPAEATEALRLYESVGFSSAAQAELRARGATTPDFEEARRWGAELQRIRATRVVAVSTRSSVLWFLQRRTRCATRMDVEESGADGLPVRRVRYFRVSCGWLGSPRIVWETGAWNYRVPL